ncbi:hypothetical protein D3C80_1570630 [compost metagenome]
MINRAAQQPFLDREPHAQVLDFQHGRPDRVVGGLAAGLGAEQYLSVGMLRRTEQFFTCRLFDDATALHDTYSVRNSFDQVQVVTDQ